MGRLISRGLLFLCLLSLTTGATALAGQGASDAPVKVPYFKLGGPIGETPKDLGMSFGGDKSVSLKELLGRLKKIREDANVPAVVISLEQPQLGLAQIQELRQAMSNIRAADKDVYVYAEYLGNGTCLLASAGSQVCITPTAPVWVIGLYGESLYVKDMLGKIGVTADIEQMGDFKSAGELFTRTGPSESAEKMINWLYDDLYRALIDGIAASRNLSKGKVQKIVDDGPYTAEEALEIGLVDAVMHRQDLLKELKKRYGDDLEIVKDYGKKKGPDIDFGSPFAIFQFFGELVKGAKGDGKDCVAIVYVDGTITVGKSPESPFGDSRGAGSTTVRKALDKAAKDDNVKAVVLRVDSPGGSALASEIILDATKRVKAKKPFVVSMGNVAGSGGYYVSCAADTIFADESTITASIGVLGGKLVTRGMWDKLGVNWHPYQRGESAAMMNSLREFNDAERAKIRHYMEDVYEIFKGHVVKYRGTKLAKDIDELAGGRVFTGAQALELGLVDKIGGLEDAIKLAAIEAKISDYDIRVIPKPKNFMDLMMEALDLGDDDDEQEITTRVSLFASESSLVKTLLPMLRQVDPLKATALEQALMRLQLLHEESVITMMPYDFVVR